LNRIADAVVANVGAPGESVTLNFEPFPFDMNSSMMLQKLGPTDETAKQSETSFSKIHIDAAGDWVHHHFDTSTGALQIRLEGPGAKAALAFWKKQVPPDDGFEAFEPKTRLLSYLHRTFAALRIVRMPWLFDVAVSAILQQRISSTEAFAQFGRIAREFGTSTPFGKALPCARDFARIPSFELERLGIDARRVGALLALSRAEAGHSFCRYEDFDRAALRSTLLRIPGVGVWTSEMIAGFGAGDTDAVPLGDVHLPSLVCRALSASTERESEDRMLALLEPFRPQRFRVIRLLWAGLFDSRTKHLIPKRRSRHAHGR
jgi:3-methyladenine DNA glycosylase/8-oxoguanine DNA glycosylase